MDLASGAGRLIITTSHPDNRGASKVARQRIWASQLATDVGGTSIAIARTDRARAGLRFQEGTVAMPTIMSAQEIGFGDSIAAVGAQPAPMELVRLREGEVAAVWHRRSS